MPTVTETQYPWMKYCKKEDIHCSCPTCDRFEECQPFECENLYSCVAQSPKSPKTPKRKIDIDYRCHSRNRDINPKYKQIEKEYEEYIKTIKNMFPK